MPDDQPTKNARLVEVVKALCAPMHPLPTEAEPRLQSMPGLKAVIFDIYGTLFTSAAGDISLAGSSGRDEAVVDALEASGGKVDPRLLPTGPARQLSEAIAEARRASDKEHPEVEIREVWLGLVHRWSAEGLVAFAEGGCPVEEVAVRHECAVNPVWPMPGEAAAREAIHRRGLECGIISNAQFYTPLLFPALMEGGLGGDLGGTGFHRGLAVWSYRMREGKPSRRLYAVMKELLARLGILPEEALFVGNDMLNDIWPAQLEGMRTALFAGDGRSLRLRDGDARVSGVEPDLVITELGQLAEVVGEA